MKLFEINNLGALYQYEANSAYEAGMKFIKDTSGASTIEEYKNLCEGDDGFRFSPQVFATEVRYNEGELSYWHTTEICGYEEYNGDLSYLESTN